MNAADTAWMLISTALVLLMTPALEPYTLVDAAVTWRASGLRVTLSAHNLFNSDYYWNGDGETADPGRPRQVLLSISKVFR